MFYFARGMAAGPSRPGTAQPAALATLHEQQQQQDIVFLDTASQLLHAVGDNVQTCEWQQLSSSCGVQQLHRTSTGSTQHHESSPSRSASISAGMQPAQSLHSCVEVRAIRSLSDLHVITCGAMCTSRQQTPTFSMFNGISHLISRMLHAMCLGAGAARHAARCAGCAAAS